MEGSSDETEYMTSPHLLESLSEYRDDPTPHYPMWRANQRFQRKIDMIFESCVTQMEISQKIQSLYATRQLCNQTPQQPTLRIIPSLFELSVSSMMPHFLESHCSRQDLSEQLYCELVSALSDDSHLRDVIEIDLDDFWRVRAHRHFSISALDRADYLSAKFSSLLAGESRGFRVESMDQFVYIGGAMLLRLELRIVPDLFNFDVLQRLPNLYELSLQYTQPFDTTAYLYQKKNIYLTENVSTVEKSGPAVCSKSLGQIARQNCVQKDQFIEFLQTYPRSQQLSDYLNLQTQQYETMPSAFPFHDITAQQQPQMTKDRFSSAPEQVFRSILTAPNMSSNDCARLANQLRFMQNLQTLKIIQARLSAELTNLLAEGLRQLNLDCANNAMRTLDLSFNDLGDQALRYLLKLAMLFPGQKKTEISELRLRNCQISGAGANIIGLAIGSPGCALRALDISGNAIGTDGFVLLSNGILKSAMKLQNKSLRKLCLSCCAIRIEAQHVAVVERLLSEAGLDAIDLRGNDCATPEEQERLREMRGVVVDGKA